MVRYDDYLDKVKLDPTKDKLELLFEMQKDLMDRYNISPKDINTLEGQDQLRACGMRLFEEIGEIFHCLKNKAWVQNQTEVDKGAVYDEIADVWHFMLELMILFELTPDQVTKLYVAKNQVNNKRIESNY